MDDRLYRSPDDRMIAGVAGGVAERLDADPSIIRIVWAVLIFLTGGLALLVYVVMAIVVPERPADAPTRASADPVGATAAGTRVGPGRELARPGRLDGPTRNDEPQRQRVARATRPTGRGSGLIAGLVLIGHRRRSSSSRELLPAFDFDLVVADPAHRPRRRAARRRARPEPAFGLTGPLPYD